MYFGALMGVMQLACVDTAPPESRPEISVADTDRDGVIDPYDNCIAEPNANQLDRDADGLGDHCDSEPDSKNFRLGQQMLSLADSDAVPLQASSNKRFTMLSRIEP